jgi:hypothetical protein
LPNSEWGVGAVCEHDRNGARLADGNASIPVSDPISVGVYVTETVQKTPPEAARAIIAFYEICRTAVNNAIDDKRSLPGIGQCAGLGARCADYLIEEIKIGIELKLRCQPRSH